METRVATCHRGICTHHPCRSNSNEHGFDVACLEGVDPFAVGPIGLGDGAAQRLIAR
jgi:hypothetical protein